MKNGGSAFPVFTSDMNLGDTAGPGMTIRDFFAAMALAGKMNGHKSTPFASGWQADAAWDCYSVAAAMLAERAKASGEAS